MPRDEDELGIMEDFEWALKDPTEERVRALGEVVSTITTKLVSAISEIQENIMQIQNQVGDLEGKISQLDSKIASGVPAVSSASSATSAPSTPSDEPIARATPRKPPAEKPMTLQSELKDLLAARRRKADGLEE